MPENDDDLYKTIKIAKIVREYRGRKYRELRKRIRDENNGHSNQKSQIPFKICMNRHETLHNYRQLNVLSETQKLLEKLFYSFVTINDKTFNFLISKFNLRSHLN